MSSRTNSHTISNAEDLYSGHAYQAGAEGGGRGMPMASLVQVDLGTPIVADPNGIVEAETLGAAGDFTIDGALLVGDKAVMDGPRGVCIVNAGASVAVITFYGTDKYGVPISEALTSNGATPVYGLKAFKTVTRVATGADTTGNLTVGTSDVLGLPFAIENVADITVIDEDDENVYQVTAKTGVAPDAITGAVDALTASATEAQTAVDFTDNSSGTAADILEDCNAPVTNVNGSGMTTAQEDELDALTVAIANNIASLGRQSDRAVVDLTDHKVAIDQNVVDVAAQKVVLDAVIDDILSIHTQLTAVVADLAARDTGTIVAADATAATDSTGDVRGTYNPTMTLDGSATLKMTYKPQARTSLGAYGVLQYRKST